MNITLKPDKAELIQQKINSGKYKNADQIIAEALQLLEQRDRASALAELPEYQIWVEETRVKVDVAIEELRRGEGIEGDVVVAQLKEKLRKARQDRA